MDRFVDPAELVEQRIDRVLTQYRESPKLLHGMRVWLGQVAEVVEAIHSIPSFFDLDTAVGDQLTLLGKRLGFGRCHCICNIQPIFGFECSGHDPSYPIVGFCDENGNWADCGPFGTSEICITDDELYRKFLKVRRYQMLALFDPESLDVALKTLFGDAATVIDHGVGRVVVAPGRDLTDLELNVIQLYPRVLPIPVGIKIRFHFGTLRPFGFGLGWGGFCEPFTDGLPLVTEHGELILLTDYPDTADTGGPETADSGDTATTLRDMPLMTGPLTRDAPWVCEVDVHPYDCAI